MGSTGAGQADWRTNDIRCRVHALCSAHSKAKKRPPLATPFPSVLLARLHSLAEALIDDQLHVDALIQGTSFCILIVGGRMVSAVASRHQEAAHRDVAVVAQVVDHRSGARIAQ